jgi:hypothetical protein
MGERPSKCDLAPPPPVVAAARAVLGAIDLDPYTTPINNRLTLAGRIYDRDSLDLETVLAEPWDCPGEGRVFLGPPIGAGASRRLLNKTLREYRAGRISQAFIWLGHNETLIRVPWLWDFPLCFPFRRLRPCFYDEELDRFLTVAPSDWSLLAYLPPAGDAELFHSRLSRFHVACTPLGRVVFHQESGDDTWRQSYQLAMGQPYDYRA